MTKEILINIGVDETRLAILEDSVLVEFTIERPDEQRRAGNIYRGRVENVLPGMQAAFVDIGEEKNAFLYIDDVISKEGEDSNVDVKRCSIQDLLHEGQEIVVQMIKEPIGTKGPRVVTQVTIPGRYLVLVPSVDYVGVSRRIVEEAERERLKTAVSKFKKAGLGLIVRTAAEEVDAAELQSDYEFLIKVWDKVKRKISKGPCPALIYQDHDLLYRILRDYLSKDVERLIIDNNDAYVKALDIVKTLAPALRSRVQLYSGEIPLFQLYSVESQVERALCKKVWLDCGAYLIFDQTEALAVIDVNTGKFTGTTSLEDTVFQTNLMAVKEIARQIRLRNLAGIIIIDFIDMSSDQQRDKVIALLEKELSRDKTKVNVLGFTSLGLLELTRKKVRQSLREIFQTECESCEGTGYILTLDSLSNKAIRLILQIAKDVHDEAMLLGVNPQIASLLIGPGGTNQEKLERKLKKTLFIKGQESLDIDQVRLLDSGTKEKIMNLALPVKEGDEVEIRIVEHHITNPGDGIGRIEGYVIDVEGAGAFVGKKVQALITKSYKTYAKARIID